MMGHPQVTYDMICQEQNKWIDPFMIQTHLG